MGKINCLPKPLLIERMKKLLDKNEFEKYLDSLKTPPPKSIRCNTLKISPKELKERLEEKSWKIKQPFEKYPEIMIVEGRFAESKLSDINKTKPIKSHEKSFILNNSQAKKSGKADFEATSMSEPNLIPLQPGELGRSLEHLLGYYYIQDIASMLPALALAPKSDEMILDLCSAPGSKTTQIAAIMQNTGTIIANDVSLGRIKILATNLERCGVANCVITKKDGIALCRKMKKMNLLFSKILVDAPCSGEGTLRSSAKTAVMWNIKTIYLLSRLQKKMIETALEILKPDGEMIYSTCTHAPEENEEVIDYTLKKFKGEIKLEIPMLPSELKTRQGIARWENTKFNSEIKNCVRIYPQDNDTEGFFVAKIKKLK